MSRFGMAELKFSPDVDGAFRMLKTLLLILCGGLGTRLSKVTNDTPKILVDINGKTFLLEIQFEFYYKKGFREFYYLTGFGHEQITQINFQKLLKKVRP